METFPDLHLESSLADVATGRPSSCYRPLPPTNAGPQIFPAYVHLPNAIEDKKRRIFDEDGMESSRARKAPRLYASPEASQRRVVSPHRDQPPSAARDSWAGSPMTSNEYGACISTLPLPLEMASLPESRTDCSSLPPAPKFDRNNPAMFRTREYITEPINAPRASESNHGTPVVIDRLSLQSRSQEYGYFYHHPTRYQSLSTSSIRPHDRAPFSAGAAYGSHYQEDMGRYGEIGMGRDSKQRKRRGNLPKETTDKLRAWFVAHLQHPYPTEDEKQDLMRQTGLQMSKFSTAVSHVLLLCFFKPRSANRSMQIKSPTGSSMPDGANFRQ